jgi:hypothetical protein
MKTNWKIFALILSLTAIFGIPACKKDNQGGTSAPTVTRVRLLSKLDTVRDVIHRINLDSISVYDQSRLRAIDSTVTAGRLNTQYGIIGTNLLTTKSVSFNGVSIYFNPGLVTDNSIIFTIPANIPYGPTQSNQLVIVTQYGSVTYSFKILQPPPVITSFTPLSGAAGDVVTITGTALDNATIVRFDSNPGQIIGTPTATEIKVKVPVGVVKANIYVTTPGGTVKSVDSFGIPAPVFKALVYDEKFATNWTLGGYSTTRDAANTEHPKRGLYAIKTTANDAANIYGGFTAGYKDAVGNGLDVIKLGITSIKFSVYGDLNTDTKTIQMYVNGNYSVAVQVKIVGGVYTDVTIPLSSFNNPAVITEIAVQNVSGSVPLTWYIDDIGFM